MQLIDVEQIAENTPTEVVDGWDAYSRCEPFGEEREMAALVVWYLNSIFACTVKDKKAFQKFNDYMPSNWIHQPPKQVVTMEDMEKTVAAMFGGVQ